MVEQFNNNPKDICIMRTEAIGEINGQESKKVVECIEKLMEKMGSHEAT